LYIITNRIAIDQDFTSIRSDYVHDGISSLCFHSHTHTHTCTIVLCGHTTFFSFVLVSEQSRVTKRSVFVCMLVRLLYRRVDTIKQWTQIQAVYMWDKPNGLSHVQLHLGVPPPMSLSQWKTRVKLEYCIVSMHVVLSQL